MSGFKTPDKKKAHCENCGKEIEEQSLDFSPAGEEGLCYECKRDQEVS